MQEVSTANPAKGTARLEQEAWGIEVPEREIVVATSGPAVLCLRPW